MLSRRARRQRSWTRASKARSLHRPTSSPVVWRAGVLTVLLDSSFGSLRPGQSIYELAQIVYTVTSLPQVHGVLFEYEDAFIQPVVGNGSFATGFVVHRADYAQLFP